jgi:hypothetical protein
MNLYNSITTRKTVTNETSPVRNATKMPRGGVVGSDANAKTNSLIVIGIASPQRLRVTVIIHWCMNQSMFAEDRVLAQSRSEVARLRHWLPHCTGSERHALGGIVAVNIRHITGSSKVLLQCFDLLNHGVVCGSQMDSSCVGLIHNRDMHCCATVFKGKWRGKQRTHIRDIVGKIDYHSCGLDERQSDDGINCDVGTSGNKNTGVLTITSLVRKAELESNSKLGRH